jgi:hypothetical protein
MFTCSIFEADKKSIGYSLMTSKGALRRELNEPLESSNADDAMLHGNRRSSRSMVEKIWKHCRSDYTPQIRCWDNRSRLSTGCLCLGARWGELGSVVCSCLWRVYLPSVSSLDFYLLIFINLTHRCPQSTLPSCLLRPETPTRLHLSLKTKRPS